MFRLGFLGVLPLLAALNPPPEPQVFHSGTRLVEVEVVVRDKNGPVKNLTKDDFTVLDQGKPQAIAIFRSATTRGAESVPLPPGTVSNRQDSRGRPLEGATVVLLDQLNTRFDLKAYQRTEIIKFLRALPSSERFPIARIAAAALSKARRWSCWTNSTPDSTSKRTNAPRSSSSCAPFRRPTGSRFTRSVRICTF